MATITRTCYRHGSSVFIYSGGVTLCITYEEHYYFQYILNNNMLTYNTYALYNIRKPYLPTGYFYAPSSSLINAILVYKIITYSVYKLALHYLSTISMQHHNWLAFDLI